MKRRSRQAQARRLKWRSKRAIELYEAGWPPGAIAQQLDCSRAWIYFVLHRESVWRAGSRNHLVSTRKIVSKLRESGLNESRLSRLLGLTKHELQRLLNGSMTPHGDNVKLTELEVSSMSPPQVLESSATVAYVRARRLIEQYGSGALLFAGIRLRHYENQGYMREIKRWRDIVAALEMLKTKMG